VDSVRPELRVKNPLWITNNQRNMVINFHRDFVASTKSNFFYGQMDKGLFYKPNNSGKICLSKQEEEHNSFLADKWVL
jgi:hypothetical protein